MLSNDVISIIVPIYNCEKYLSRCVESIIGQTYKNIEIILINDGSIDDSELICLKYKKIDKRITYYKKNNSGVSETRNFGILKAKGKYICFIDSDDYYDAFFIEKLYKRILEDNTQLCLCGFNFDGTNKKSDEHLLLKKYSGINDAKKILQALLDVKKQNHISGYIWRCMFLREYIIKNNILFKKFRQSEDFLFLVELLSKIKKCSVLDEKLYFYMINENSTTHKFQKTLKHDEFEINRFIENNIINNDEKLLKIFRNCWCNTFIDCVRNILRNNISFRSKITEIREVKKELKKYLKGDYNCFTFNKKIALYICKFNLEFILIVVYNLKHRGD